MTIPFRLRDAGETMMRAIIGISILLLLQITAQAQSKLESLFFITNLVPPSQLEKEGFSADHRSNEFILENKNLSIKIIIREESPCRFGITEIRRGMGYYSFFDMNQTLAIDFSDDQKEFKDSVYDPLYSRKVSLKFARPVVFHFAMAPEQIDINNMRIESIINVLKKEQNNNQTFDEFAKDMLESDYEYESAKIFFPKTDVYRSVAQQFRNEHCKGRLF